MSFDDRTLFVGLLAVGWLFVGCGRDRSEAPEGVQTPSAAAASIVPAETPSEAAKTKMLAAKEALFTKLSSRLMEAMSGPGPASAISVCQQEAPKIAATVGEEQGVRIGRTGVRLRNPKNAAPSWAESLVNERTETPTFVVLDNGDSAALLPIKLQGQCLMCHGPKEQIAPVIQDQLAKLYPNDEATGFQQDELRGWFWIELPPG